jgi:two-component system heavy metal sensor histidine kinase CusS
VSEDAHVAAEQRDLATFLLWFFLPQVLLYAFGAIATGLLLMVFWVTMLSLAAHLRTLIIGSLRLRFANLELIEDLSIAKDEAEAASRTKSMLLANVSHELRTPLAALRTTLEVAASQERSAPAYRTAIREASALVTQTQSLVSNLLMLARLDARQLAVETTEVGLRAFVDDCWRPFEGQAADRQLTFSNQVGPDTTVRSDPDQLRIVVGNLLANAAAYTAARGSIVVREGAAGALLEVVDSGPPIPDELLPRIFDRFSRGDAARSGGVHCGIGLALVRGVCEVLGLEASAENAPDGSVCFKIAGAVRGRARPSPAISRAS